MPKSPLVSDIDHHYGRLRSTSPDPAGGLKCVAERARRDLAHGLNILSPQYPTESGETDKVKLFSS